MRRAYGLRPYRPDFTCPYCPFHTDEARQLIVHLFFESQYSEILKELASKWED